MEKHKLAEQILATVNDLLIEQRFASQDRHRGEGNTHSSSQIHKERIPKMYSIQKSNQWHFGLKAHITADADSGLVQ